MLGKLHIQIIFLVLFTGSGIIPLQAQNEEESTVVAEIGNVQITRAEVEQEAVRQLEQLEMEELRFAAEQRKKRHEILENTLDQMISNRLIELEADSLGVNRDQFVQNEVQEKIKQPTDEDVNRFYEENKSRIRGTKEEVLPQIKAFLARQQSQQATHELIARLKEKYEVESKLEPLRFDITAAGKPSIGPENAPVTIVEFSDFECPYCSRFNETIKEVKQTYGDQVRVVFRHFPLKSIHPNAQKAAEASLCAEEQGKFWEMHDLMFQDQKNLAVESLKQKAASLNLETTSFEECLDSGKYSQEVEEDVNDGLLAGVSGTPAIFVNGRPFSGAISFEELSGAIEEELARE